MEHFIIGTAGHIDHGKTSLIKALTNIDCDTHPEEKKRGITINLGFAYIKRDDGDYTAFVDVPGHHKFISNMVAGAAGIDFVMLVVAADDGIMPQTKEHLKICSLLGIKSGIVVINKCDSVDSDGVELCTEEVKEFVEGTFLEDKPIFTVSALTGMGIDELRDYLLKGDYIVNRRPDKDFFRMSVDRMFNVSGFGVIVTGTVAQNSISVGDSISLVPGDLSCKVRGIQRHSSQVETTYQGTRVAIDLTGVKKEDIEFGSILCDIAPPAITRFDAMLTMMDDVEISENKFDAIMLCGTAKISVKVKIIEYFDDGEGVKATAQIDLNREWYMAYGDNFILRNSSSDHTIAGGEVIDPLSLNHKKMSETLKSKLRLLGLSPINYIENKVVESIEILNIESFIPVLQMKRENIETLLSASENIKLFAGGKLLIKRKIEEFSELIIKGFTKYSKTNPLSVIGVTRRKLLDFAGDYTLYKNQKSNDEAASIILDMMEREGIMARNGNNWRLPGMRLEISDTEKSNIQKIESIIASYGYSPFELDDINGEGYSLGIDSRSCKYIITYLLELKRIVRVNEMFFFGEKFSEARSKVIAYLKEHSKEGIKAAEYRDLLGVNRKIAVAHLEAFDKEKTLIRKNDVRYLP